MAIDIFMSVGRASTDIQEDFIKAIEDLLQNDGLSPRAVGRNEFSSKQPLQFIQELMQKCKGTIIIAFERLYVAEGEEKRGSSQAKTIKSEILPTVWNQIEASMAYVLGQPLLVIVEEGSRNEGLLEAGYDWYVMKVKIDSSSLNTKEFRGVFSDWVKRVQTFNDYQEKRKKELPSEFDFSNIKIHDFFSLLTPGQLWKTILAIGTIITASYYFGVFMTKYVLK